MKLDGWLIRQLADDENQVFWRVTSMNCQSTICAPPRMRFRLITPILLALLATLTLASCAAHDPMKDIVATFVVVRHAEKATDDPRDPSLSAAGQARALALARQFANVRLTAAYATAYRRTQQTAAPSAKASGIAVTTYDASRPASAFATELRTAHSHGTVLVVGHSNTVPGIVAALCACAVEPLGEDDYDRLYEVTMDGSGAATLVQRKY